MSAALIEANKNRQAAIKKYLNCRKLPLPAKVIKIKNSANPNPPATVNLVALTGSVTDAKTMKRQTNGAPIKISRDVVFSAALLNMD